MLFYVKFSSQGKALAEKKERVALERTRELKKESLEFQETVKKIILNPELTEKARKSLIEEDREIEAKKEQKKGRGFSR